MSTHQTKQAIRVANVPKEEFERQVESDNAPTVTNPTKYVVLVCANEIRMHNIERETYDVAKRTKFIRLSSETGIPVTELTGVVRLRCHISLRLLALYRDQDALLEMKSSILAMMIASAKQIMPIPNAMAPRIS
jgi:hypothetical protein